MFEKIRKNNLAILAILGAALVGGALPVFTKIAVEEIPPFSFTFLRFLIASVFILPLFIRERPKIDRGSAKIILLSILATANVTLFAFGVKLTTASIGQMLYVAVPIVAGVFSYFILKEKITAKKALGVALGFAGASLIVFQPLFAGNLEFAGDFTGNVLLLVAIFSFALYTVLSKSAQKKYSPMYLTAIFSFTTVAVMSLFLPADLGTNWWSSVSTTSILATLYVGIFGTLVYYLLYQYAIKHGSPLIASVILYIQPIVTIGWASGLLGEQLTLYFVLGAVLTFVGAWIITRAKSKVSK